MSGHILRMLGRIGLTAALLAANLSCTGPSREQPTPPAEQWDGSPSTLFAGHRGRVLVLLLGMDGCTGTAAATPILKDYAARKVRGVSVVRLDVPPPVGEFKTLAAGSLPFAHGIDAERLVADELDFFYYPTLYIFDPQGELRFAGGCDKDRLPKMVSEILAEKPGEKKHVYTPPLPAEGTRAPAFSGRTLDGDAVTLEELRGERATVLIFAKTKCRFTMKAFAGMQQLHELFRDKQVAAVIINREESPDVIRPIYAKHAPGVTVIHDEQAEITRSYGVNAAPFCFVLDGEGTITKRMPYTQDAATDAINLALGLTPAPPSGPATGAG